MPLAVPVTPHHALGRGCAGRVRYRCLDAAQRDLVRLAEDIAAGRAEEKYPNAMATLSVYVCSGRRGCGFYHIGHESRAMRAARLADRKYADARSSSSGSS